MFVARIYPPVNVYISMENHHFWWVNPLSMAIFNSYVSLPQGTSHMQLSYVLVTFFSFQDSKWLTWNVLELQDMWSEERQASIIGAMVVMLVMVLWGCFFFFAQQPAIATPTKRGKSSPTTVISGQFYLDLFGLSLLNFQGYLQNCGDKWPAELFFLPI